MSGDVVIRAENLSKHYRIAHQALRLRYRTLRDDLLALPRQLWTMARGAAMQEEEFWALRDVSFEVKQGEVLGVIGRNGAGKSTLLKLLSRITEPTSGYADIFGRVGSLLEVGTGFHPELTGRENIYLSGAIIGMQREEVRRKFDEIVDFAEVEKFIDTPAKHYSSGMYMRLGFAVAAHLEPEILLVDEVLAVGDMQFQRKCLGKMGEVAKEGRTVLFVSHNMAAVLSLCSRGLLLKEGRVEVSGAIRMVSDHYLASGITFSGESHFPAYPLHFDKPFHFQKITLLRPDGQVSSNVDLLEGLNVQITYQITRPLKGVKISFRLRNAAGIYVLASSDIDENPQQRLQSNRMPGVFISHCHISRQFLRPGRYTIDIWAGYPSIRTLDEHFQSIAFDVVDTGSVEALIGEGNSETILSPVFSWVTSAFE